MKTLENFGEAFQVTGYLESESANAEKNYILNSLGHSPKKFNIRVNSDRVDNDSRVISILILPKVLKDGSEYKKYVFSFSFSHYKEKYGKLPIERVILDRISQDSPIVRIW